MKRCKNQVSESSSRLSSSTEWCQSYLSSQPIYFGNGASSQFYNLGFQDRNMLPPNLELVTPSADGMDYSTLHPATSLNYFSSQLVFPNNVGQDLYHNPSAYRMLTCPVENIPKVVLAQDGINVVTACSGGSPSAVDLLQPQAFMNNVYLPYYNPFHYQPSMAQSVSTQCNQYLPSSGSISNHNCFSTDLVPRQSLSGHTILVPTSLPNHVFSQALYKASGHNLGGFEVMSGVAPGMQLRSSTPSKQNIVQECTVFKASKKHVSPSSPPVISRQQKKRKPNQSPSGARDRRKSKTASLCNSELHKNDEVRAYKQQSIRYFNNGVEVDKHGKQISK
jgi:hypothetical protein